MHQFPPGFWQVYGQEGGKVFDKTWGFLHIDFKNTGFFLLILATNDEFTAKIIRRSPKKIGRLKKIIFFHIFFTYIGL